MQFIYETTGTYPAMMVYDIWDYSAMPVSQGVDNPVVENMIEWADMGGIVGFHWHWFVPDNKFIKSGSQWWQSFYAEHVSSEFNLETIMDNPGSENYNLLLNDIDLISEQLKRFQESGIPVLWRPLHEASGKWFWWGASGPDAYKKLWILMYDRMTNYHGLNNLIWIWNSHGKDWFPGEEYVDIVSDDVGADKNQHLSYQDRYYNFVRDLYDLGTMKMLALTETGPIPSINTMARDRAIWSFWVNWRGTHETPLSTSAEFLKQTYNDPRVITLNDLPPLYSNNPDDLYEETIIWEGNKSAPAWSWNELQMVTWGGELGTYNPDMIKAGHVINITFKSGSVPILVTGGNPDVEFNALKVSASVGEYRTASFSCDEILSAYTDINTDTWALLVRSASEIELIKISVTNRVP